MIKDCHVGREISGIGRIVGCDNPGIEDDGISHDFNFINAIVETPRSNRDGQEGERDSRDSATEGGDREPSATTESPNAGSPSPRTVAAISDGQSELDTLQSEYENQCRKSLKQTETCCNDPMSCLTGNGSKSSSGVSMLLQMAAGTVTTMAGLSGACGAMGTVSTAMAGINTALALKCSQKISQCNSACGRVAQRAREASKNCDNGSCGRSDAEEEIGDNLAEYRRKNNNQTLTEADYERAITRASKKYSSSYISKFNEIASNADECDNYGGQAVQQQSQAVASLYAAKIAGLCKQQATASDPNNVATNAFNVNCSDPTNAANPVCQNQCNRANAANDPVCAQLLGLGTSGFGSGTGTGNGLADPNALSSLGSGSVDEFEDQQSMLDANVAAQSAKANVSGGSGGGGVPGGGGSTGGGGDGGAAGGGAEGGLNTGILQGTKSGSGYSQPFVRSSMGGGGYSSGGSPARGVASEGKPFNPRDFLPGGKMDPKRKLAGLASATPEIGAVHGNIFTNITNRFLQVCLRDGLFDCETLRKNSKPRN